MHMRSLRPGYRRELAERKRRGEAAAPALLKACEKALFELDGFLGCCGKDEIRDSFQGFSKAAKMCEAAIAKAEGKPCPT